MSPEDMKQVEDKAELAVRRYFDHYLTNVFPQQVATIQKDVIQEIDSHNKDDAAHGGVKVKVGKLIWVMMGVAAAGGAGGTVVQKILSAVGS